MRYTAGETIPAGSTVTVDTLTGKVVATASLDSTRLGVIVGRAVAGQPLETIGDGRVVPIATPSSMAAEQEAEDLARIVELLDHAASIACTLEDEDLAGLVLAGASATVAALRARLSALRA